MKFLIPIAADEDLFPRAEFHFPKPLIEVDGAPLIGRVIDNILDADPDAEFIFVVRAEHCRKFGLDLTLEQACKKRCVIVPVEKSTAGAACSALLAIDGIDLEGGLVICNGDQIIPQGIAEAIASFQHQGSDAGVITFPSVHPRWSYVRMDDNGNVCEAAEKRVISRKAIAGFYYFSRGDYFVEAAKAAILNDRSFDGVFFVAPILNELILAGRAIKEYSIPADHYQSLFSPHRVESYERQLQGQRLAKAQQTGKDLQVVIPMAGLGSRFADAGYDKPKPFIDVAGKTMIERVMDNLSIPGAQFLLIARQEHLDKEPETVARLKSLGNVKFAPIDFVTEGAACTVLTASRLWDRDAPLLIANCDQIVDFDCGEFIHDAEARGLDGSILTFVDKHRDPKWSFARTDDNGLVREVREKVAISDIATVGLYYFATAQLFADAAIEMIAHNERVNNEFYVCPVYNHAIARGARIGVFDVPADAMHGIGTPADLTAFLKQRYDV